MTGRRILSGLVAASCIAHLIPAAVADEEGEAGAGAEPDVPEWIPTMLAAKQLCLDYRDLKKRGVEGMELEEGLKKATNAVLMLLFMHGELINTDAEFRRAAMPDVNGVGNVWDRSSDFIRECWNPDSVELRSPWGTFLERQVRTQGCVRMAQKTSEFESRCFPSGMSMALDALHWAGAIEDLEKMYDKNKPMKTDDGKLALRWPNVMMRTPITFKGIRNKQIWNRGESSSIDAVRELVESNVETIRGELQAVKDGGHFQSIFFHLLGGGQWDQFRLYDSRTWSSALCKVTPKTCEIFRNQLPGANSGLPYVAANHEEVALYRLAPGTRVLPHNGGHNGRINIEIVLEGGEDAMLKVHNDINNATDVELSSKEAVAFSDGWSWEKQNGAGDTYYLVVGIMHPDIDGASYAEGFNGKTSSDTFKTGQLTEFKELAKKKREEKKAKKEAKKAAKEAEAANEEL